MVSKCDEDSKEFDNIQKDVFIHEEAIKSSIVEISFQQSGNLLSKTFQR